MTLRSTNNLPNSDVDLQTPFSMRLRSSPEMGKYTLLLNIADQEVGMFLTIAYEATPVRVNVNLTELNAAFTELQIIDRNLNNEIVGRIASELPPLLATKITAPSIVMQFSFSKPHHMLRVTLLPRLLDVPATHSVSLTEFHG